MEWRRPSVCPSVFLSLHAVRTPAHQARTNGRKFKFGGNILQSHNVVTEIPFSDRKASKVQGLMGRSNFRTGAVRGALLLIRLK